MLNAWRTSRRIGQFVLNEKGIKLFVGTANRLVFGYGMGNEPVEANEMMGE